MLLLLAIAGWIAWSGLAREERDGVPDVAGDTVSEADAHDLQTPPASQAEIDTPSADDSPEDRARSTREASADGTGQGTGSVLVRVLPCSGSSTTVFAGSLVTFGVGDPSLATRRFVTAADGSCKLEDVPPGDFRVALDLGWNVEGVVRAGERSNAVLDLRDGFGFRGLVVDASGAPIRGASIHLSRPMDLSEAEVVARSDDRGRFELACSSGGGYLVARAPGHAPSRPLWHLRTLDTRSEHHHRFVLPADGASLLVHVRRGPGAAVEDAHVEVRETDRESSRSAGGPDTFTPLAARTDALGRALLEGLARSEASVRVHVAGAAPWLGSVDLSTESHQRLEVVLEPAVRIHGTVRDTNGVGLGGVRVSARARDGAWSARRSAAQDGSFALENLGAGTIYFDVDAGGAGSCFETLHARPGDDLRFDAVVADGAPIEGRVTDIVGEPLVFWRVMAIVETRGQPWRSEAISGADGEFAIQRVPGASATLHVSAARAVKGSPERELPILTLRDVSPGGPPLDIRVNPPSAFVELLLAEEGLEGGPVQVRLRQSASDLEVIVERDAETTLRFGPLAPGSYRLSIGTPGDFAAEIDLGEQTLRANDTVRLGPVRLPRQR
jgi:hypothetical protein